MQLAAAAAQPVPLALHELATNAAKYGALSMRCGRITLSWSLDCPAEPLRLQWTERGGPAGPDQPSHRGFGTRVTEATITGQPGGRIERRWEGEGLACIIEVPLARAVPEHGGAALAGK